MRRLIIDGQLFQTPAWHRGMGKYSMELLRALLKYNESHHVWDSVELIISSRIPIEAGATQAIKKFLPDVKVKKLHLLPAEINNVVPTNKNRTVVEEYVNTVSRPKDAVDFLILSVLQGGIAPAFPSQANVHKILLFYDLIPLMFFKTYLSVDRVREEYATHLAEFFQADTYLAISKTVANDLAWHTGTSSKRIFNINGGPIKHGSDSKPIDIPKPFILMHTGDDLRKNNRRGILAFEDFNQKHKNKYTLVVSSTFTEHEMRELKRLSKNIIFTGNVSGEQLNYLYKECEALFFPTEYEGLGLPLLEAMEWNKPILCSDIPVFREITPDLVEYFDYRDVQDMSAALGRLAQGKVAPNSKGYKKVLARYTWELTAKEAVAAIVRRGLSYKKPERPLTVFTPNPSQSFLGGHVQLLGSELGRMFKVGYRYEGVRTKVEQRINHTAYISPQSTSIDGRVTLESNGELCLYHVANNAACAKTLFAALGNPGIAVLYDAAIPLAWEALKHLGLLHHSRFNAELSLSQQFGEANDFLVSIVASQKVIIVHDKPLLNKLEKLAELVGRDNIKLVYTPMPAVETVYPDILPNRKAEELTVQAESANLPIDGHTIFYSLYNGLQNADMKPLADHSLLELVSSCGSVKVTDDSSISKILQALGDALGSGGVSLSERQRQALMERSRKSHTYYSTAAIVSKVAEELTHEQ